LSYFLIFPCKQPHNQLKQRSVGALASSCTYSRICQPQIKELNSYVALRKTYTSSLGNKQELLDGGSFGGPAQNDNVRMASTMSNQELVQTGRKQMDDTDQTIERSKKVVEDTINIGAETASTLKGQTDQLGRITNELDTIQFSIKKASQLVKEIGRQVCYLSGWFYNLGVFPFLDCNSGMQLRSVSSLRGAMRHTCPTIYLESHWYKSRQFSYSLHIG
jgi:hypothetical protein